MLASLCCLFTQIDISWFFICHVILDCILDILNIMLGFSGPCLTLWKLLLFFVLAGSWTDFFQIASSDKPYVNYGPNVTSFINSFATLFVFEGNDNPLQYSCLQSSKDRGAWWTTIHGIAKSQTGLSDFTICGHHVAILTYGLWSISVQFSKLMECSFLSKLYMDILGVYPIVKD